MFQKILRARILFSVCALLIGFFCFSIARAHTSQSIYTDSLQNNWENWSWAAVNLNNASPVHSGSASTSINAAAWQAFYLHHAPFTTGGYTDFVFWIHGGTSGGQRLQVQALVNGSAQTAVILSPLAANSW